MVQSLKKTEEKAALKKNRRVLKNLEHKYWYKNLIDIGWTVDFRKLKI